MFKRGGRDKRTRQRGAVLVEAAIIAPIVFAAVFGTMEFGYAYFGKLTIEHMSVAGARSASGGANDTLSDYTALQAVRAAETGIPNESIQVVVIYRANSPSDRVPTACKTASVSNTSVVRGCNRYVASDLKRPSSNFGCLDGSGNPTKPDHFWCPTSRKSALTGTNGPPDYVGVYVKGLHNNLIGLFGKTFTFTNDTVIKIEPRTLK